jgi:hypothetical protein
MNLWTRHVPKFPRVVLNIHASDYWTDHCPLSSRFLVRERTEARLGRPGYHDHTPDLGRRSPTDNISEAN